MYYTETFTSRKKKFKSLELMFQPDKVLFHKVLLTINKLQRKKKSEI